MAAQAFTATGSWTCPNGVFWALVECWGGGGAGGAATGNPANGSGGAGGNYARSLVPVVPGTTYTVTVGAAVTGNKTNTNTQNKGNPSWFSTTGTVFADGGLGGNPATTNSSVGALVTASSALSIGDRVQKGGNGIAGVLSSSGGAGGGAGGPFGDGSGTAAGAGNPGTGTGRASNTTAGSAGGAGNTYGGGGAGGYANNATDRAGGDGAAGYVRVTWGFEQFNNAIDRGASCASAGVISIGAKG